MNPTISGIKCRTCGVRNFLEAEFCKRCNASFEQYEEKNTYMYQKSEGNLPPEPAAPQYQFTRMQAKDFKTIGYVAAALMAFYLVFAFLPAAMKPKPSKTTSTISENTTVNSRTYIAVDEAAFSEMVTVADDAALTRLGVEGKVFAIQPQTKIRIVDAGLSKSKITVLEGNQQGRSGWVPNEYLGK